VSCAARSFIVLLFRRLVLVDELWVERREWSGWFELSESREVDDGKKCEHTLLHRAAITLSFRLLLFFGRFVVG
jgi:hypothetical protein